MRPSVRCRDAIKPLEDALAPIIQSGATGLVAILGEHGGGKTTALRHIAAVLRPGRRVRLLDEPRGIRLTTGPQAPLVIYTAPAHREPPPVGADLGVFTLQPWGTDEWIEYLLSRHRTKIDSVMKRLQACRDIGELTGNPLLNRVVLDAFAEDESLREIDPALKRFVRREFQDRVLRKDARTFALNRMFGGDPGAVAERLAKSSHRPVALQALRLRQVQRVLAIERVLDDLGRGVTPRYFVQQFESRFIDAVGPAVARRPGPIDTLKRMMRDKRADRSHATAAGILNAARIGWVPEPGARPNLAGAHLPEAPWRSVRLPAVRLSGANLSGADLSESRLAKADLSDAILHATVLYDASIHGIHAERARCRGAVFAYARADGARFRNADLTRADFEGARLIHAEFRGADLTDARLVRANLQGASLDDTRLSGADFTAAFLREASLPDLDLRAVTFTGAHLSRANLRGCNLEEQHMPGADFEHANLVRALLSASVMPQANFRNANLSDAGLAHVEWEGADLRGAELQHASFHLGSSRSGLVGSPLACEGSRTGFYTDDYDEQTFRPPEDIRKASLRGADLRGARVEDTDFYLVDLRDAIYDADQEAHFRRCGAILEARV